MTAQDLLDQFRRDMADTRKPYFWSDEEVFGYMDDAYKMFVRLTGGIADFTSEFTSVPIVTGEAVADLDKRILRVTEARLASSGQPISVVNFTDLKFAARDDYGITRALFNDKTPGIVRYMVIGQERNKCRWVQIPEADDTAELSVYRLPRASIQTDGSNAEFEFDEIGEEHIPHLCLWMRHRGYNKHDADAYDPQAAERFKAEFSGYCDQAKREWERYKHKNRVVAYGGL